MFFEDWQNNGLHGRAAWAVRKRRRMEIEGKDLRCLEKHMPQ